MKKITENTLKLIEKERDGEQVNSTLIAKALGFEIYNFNSYSVLSYDLFYIIPLKNLDKFIKNKILTQV